MSPPSEATTASDTPERAIDPAQYGTTADEAYQVIGALASATGLFDHPEVQRALDYFSGGHLDGSLLPFVLDAPRA